MPRIRRGGGRLRAGGGRTRNEDCCCEETDDHVPCSDVSGTNEFMALYDAEVKFEGGTWGEDDACCDAFFAGPFAMSDDGTSNCQIWDSANLPLPCGMNGAAGMAIQMGLVCTGVGSERHLRLNSFGCYSANKAAQVGGDIGWLAQWPTYDFPPTITIGQWYDIGTPDSISGSVTECKPDSGDPPHMYVRFV